MQWRNLKLLEKNLMYNLVITEYANADLESIVSYIVNELSNEVAATSLLDGVEKCYSHLKNTPYMYELCNNSQLKKMQYRRIVINNYIMVYRIDDNNKIVYILRFFYGRRDYINLI